MAFRWIVNAGLVAVPVGATLGVLFGIDASRSAAGQAPLFSPPKGSGSSGSGGSSGTGDSTGGGGGSTGSVSSNGTTNSMYCQLAYGITPPSKGENYTLNPNQWAVTNGVSSLCLNVTTFDNETYATNLSAPSWSASWKYPQVTSGNDVWAYPNVMVNDGIPVLLSDLSSIMIDVSWTYGVGNTTASSTDTAALDAVSANFNVAVDMFMDASSTMSSNSTGASNEVMVWFGHLGDTAQALGNSTNGVVSTYTLNGTVFDLYYGTNDQKQDVYTWVTADMAETFVGDLKQLLTVLNTTTSSIYPGLPLDIYLGEFAFGSEAYYADQWLTFYVQSLSIDIQKT